MKHTTKAVKAVNINRITSLFLVIAFVFAFIPAFNISLVVSAADVGVYIAGINKSDTDLGDCEQLIVVVADGSDAQVYMYEKSGNSWSMVDTATGVVGSEGVKDDAHEGYSATPRGLWDLGFSFGTENLSSEHLKIEYRQLKGTEEWVDDPNSSHYNQWVDKATGSKDWKSSEKLKSAGTAYKYAVVVEYNTNPVVAGKGSAIFLHVKTASSTAGCIAIPEDKMLSTLKWLDSSKSPKILNCTKEDKANGENNSTNAGNSLNNGQPSQSIESSNDAVDANDRTWVDVKDLFRHGGSYNPNSNTDSSSMTTDPSYEPGKATGQYAIRLNDGNWYWYHQTPTPDGCIYCGTWTTMTCKSTSEILGINGCAVYSAAIIASNLTGKEITPTVLLKDLGAEVADNNSSFDTTKSSYFSNGVEMWAEKTATFMCSKYSLQSTGPIGELGEKELKAKVDETLDKKGMIWYQVESAEEGNWFPPYETDQHILTIRRHEGDNYYVLDEVMSDTSLMNNAVPWSDIYSHLHSAKMMIGFWNPNLGTSTSGVSSIGNGWYDTDFDSGNNKGKIRLGKDILAYESLPWDKKSSTFSVDTNMMLTDMYKWVHGKSSTDAKSALGVWNPDKVFNGESGSASRIAFDNGSKSNLATIANTNGFKQSTVTSHYISTIDGINCIACKVPPAVLNKNYNIGFGDYNKAVMENNLWQVVNNTYSYKLSTGKFKLCAVMQNKSDNNIYYLPLVAVKQNTDTFPGGVTNTRLRLSASDMTSMTAKFTSTGQIDKFTNISRDGLSNIKELAPNDVMGVMNESGYGNSSWTAWDSTWAAVELWDVPKDVQTYILNNLKLIGFVVWPD